MSTLPRSHPFWSQPCGPGEAPPGPGSSASHQCHTDREKGPQERHILPWSSLGQERRVIPSGKGLCWDEAPTIMASKSGSHGALPGKGPGTQLHSPVPEKSLKLMSPCPVSPSAPQLPASIIPVSYKPYASCLSILPVLSVSQPPFNCKDIASQAWPFSGFSSCHSCFKLICGFPGLLG